MEAINSAPSEISTKFYSKIQAAQAAGGGDPGNGAVVWEDNCEECHSLEGEAMVGPDLSTIGDKGIKFIAESILSPAKKITPGFETYTVETKDGTKIIGVKSAEDASLVTIIKKNGEEEEIAKTDIKSMAVDENASVMPEDLNEAMTVKDFQDLQAFMIMQKAKKKDGE